MSIVSGRLASFRMSTGTTGSAPVVIDYIGKWTINISQDSVEANYFGSYWSAGAPVGQKWSGSVEGWFDATTGGYQLLAWQDIFSAKLVQDARFYVGGSTGSTGIFYMPANSTQCTIQTTDAGAYLTNFKHTVGAKELGTITFDVVGYKGIILCLGVSSNANFIIAESTA